MGVVQGVWLPVPDFHPKKLATGTFMQVSLLLVHNVAYSKGFLRKLWVLKGVGLSYRSKW
jgi:hypothetical protein